MHVAAYVPIFSEFPSRILFFSEILTSRCVKAQWSGEVQYFGEGEVKGVDKNFVEMRSGGKPYILRDPAEGPSLNICG